MEFNPNHPVTQTLRDRGAAMPYVMSERLARLLELVRAGVCRKPHLALMSGLSLRLLKLLLEGLVEHGYIVSVKTDRNDWSWVPVEAEAATRAAAARKARASKKKAWQRAARKRLQAKPRKLPRGHQLEAQTQTCVPAAQARPIRKTAVASVWELGGRMATTTTKGEQT